MKKISKLTIALGLAGAALILGVHGRTVAQGSLRIGGSNSNFGTHAIQGGFVPDPKQITGIVSGGSLNAGSMGLGNGCTGYVTAQPDLIVNYSSPASFLRFYFQGQGDTTLIINDAAGRWRCNDDTAGLNPQVDIQNPPGGQYDIWIGSYEAGANIRGTLYVTELRSNQARP